MLKAVLRNDEESRCFREYFRACLGSLSCLTVKNFLPTAEAESRKLVRVARLELAASWSQTRRPTNWATPGYARIEEKRVNEAKASGKSGQALQRSPWTAAPGSLHGASGHHNWATPGYTRIEEKCVNEAKAKGKSGQALQRSQTASSNSTHSNLLYYNERQRKLQLFSENAVRWLL